MVITFILLLCGITIAIIAYPLYFQAIVPYLENVANTAEFNEQDALLSALSELDEDYQLDKLSQIDYERLKLYFQRRYLQAKQNAVSA